MLAFQAFRLDLVEERLWNGSKLLALRRKPFAILKFLAQNPKRLVTHAEVLEHVAIELGVPLLELRAAVALGDRALVREALAKCLESAGSPDFTAAAALLG